MENFEVEDIPAEKVKPQRKRRLTDAEMVDRVYNRVRAELLKEKELLQKNAEEQLVAKAKLVAKEPLPAKEEEKENVPPVQKRLFKLVSRPASSSHIR